jgi:CGNR zinc finger
MYVRMAHEGTDGMGGRGRRIATSVRPHAWVEALAAGLNWPALWLDRWRKDRARFSRARARPGHATTGAAAMAPPQRDWYWRPYSAWKAAAAILEPSLPLKGWPPDLPLPTTSAGGRHVRKFPIIRHIAPETVRRFQRLATVAPVQLWLSDLAADSWRKEKERTEEARRAGVPWLVATGAALAPSLYAPSARLRGTDDPRGAVVKAVWRLLQDPEADRLKRCPRCAKWFADTSKSVSQRWCEAACRERAWNRAARRKAEHKQYRPKQVSRGRATRTRGRK